MASGTINIILVSITSNALSYSLTPIIINTNNSIERSNLLSTTIFFTIFIFLALAIIQDYCSDFIVSLLYPGLANRNLDLLSEMYSLYAYISILSVLNGAFTAICYANEKLIRTVFVPIIAMAAQIIILYLSNNRDVELIVISYAVNQLIIAIFLGGICLKELSFNIKIDDRFLSLKNNTIPLLLSSFVSKSDLIVDRNLLSNLSAGLISSLHYGQLFVNSGLSILTKGLSVVSLTKLSRLHKVNEYKFELYLNVILKYLFVFLIYTQFTFVINAHGIIYFLFGCDDYDIDIDFISKIVICLSGMFFGGALSTVIVNAYYVKGFNSFVAKVSIILHIIGLIAKIALFKVYGFYVIPIVFSVKSIINFLVLFFYYNISIRSGVFRFDINYVVKLAVFISVLIIMQFASSVYDSNVLFNMLLGTLMFGIFYFKELLLLSKDSYVS